MGNLHKAYVTFGKRPEALKKLLKTQDNDIAVFVELCKNGKWNASDIIEAATMSFDPLEQGFFAGIASSVAGAFSGAKYRRSFTILQHPDIGRVLATQDGMDEVFRASQPTGPIELKVVIKWEFRSKNPDERVTKAADDADLAAKVNAAADFSRIMETVARAVKKEFKKNGSAGLQAVIQTVLESETQRAINDAQEEFYRVLGLTKSKVVWQDAKTIGSAIWSTVSATITTVGIASSIAAGGPAGLAASLIYYCSNGLQALKGFADTYHSLKNSFGDIGSNIASCESSMKVLEDQWKENQQYANVLEASRTVIQSIFPESVVASTKSVSGRLEQIGTACDRTELKSRQLSPKLNEALQNLSAAQSVLEDLEEILSDVDSRVVDSLLRDLRINFRALTDTFEQTFDTMASINGKVLDYRKRMRAMNEMLTAFQAKELVWFKIFDMAWGYYVDFANDLAGDLAPDPVGETWKKVNDVCEKIDDFQTYVEDAGTLKENLETLYEMATKKEGEE